MVGVGHEIKKRVAYKGKLVRNHFTALYKSTQQLIFNNAIPIH